MKAPRDAYGPSAKLPRRFFLRRLLPTDGNTTRPFLPANAPAYRRARQRKLRSLPKTKINERKSFMRNPSVYLKMRVLGAIDLAPGDSIQARIKAISQMSC